MSKKSLIAIIVRLHGNLGVPAVGGVPEVFRDGEEGRLIPLDNVDSDATMRRARIAARRRYLGCFEANNVAAKLTGFLDPAFREIASL